MHTEKSVGKSKVNSGKQFLQQLNAGIQIETIEAKAYDLHKKEIELNKHKTEISGAISEIE
jgi:molybdopterin/thiamine biosynthesis adenylyltransferase